MKNIIEKLKTTRILGAIGIIGLILGTIMPYVKYNFFGYKYSISLWGYWEGKVVMVLAIANLLFIFKDIVEKYVPALFNTGVGSKIKDLNSAKYSLVFTILAGLFALYLTIRLDIDFKYYNIGFYSLWVGAICLVLYSVLYKKSGHDQVEQTPDEN